jgi:uncharacterized protein (TIGR02646 family)
MKYIEKDIKNEPQSLRIYKNSTPDASFSGFSNTQEVRLALLKEQGFLCAYCMKRISLNLNENYKPQIEIEHYKSQDNFPEEDLNYMNMLGVCNGTIRKETDVIEHCDKSKKSGELKRLNPTKKNCSEDLLTYNLNGEIKPITKKPEVEHEINIVLNLNNKYLIEYRLDALDKARKDFEKDNPQKDGKRWNKEMFIEEIKKYKTKKNDKFKPYCQFIIWYFNELSKKKKYSTKD